MKFNGFLKDKYKDNELIYINLLVRGRNIIEFLRLIYLDLVILVLSGYFSVVFYYDCSIILILTRLKYCFFF